MKYQTLRRLAVGTVVFSLFALTTASARAAFTTINAPSPFNEIPEDGHRTMAGNIYGGTFVRNGVNLSNGIVTLTRIDDSMTNNGVLGLVSGSPGDASDRVWHDGFTDAVAKVRFARDSQAFGFFEGASGSTASANYTKLFDVSGSGYNVTGASLLQDMIGKTFRWGRSRGVGGFHSSLPSNNPDGLDHMVSYQVTGLHDAGPFTVWLLFWEDRNAGESNQQGGANFNSDRDLNDLVVEIRASAVAVPEPTTGALVLAGLGVLCAGRRRCQV